MPNRGLIGMVALFAAMLMVAAGASAHGNLQTPITDELPAVTTTVTTPEVPAQAEAPPITPVPVPSVPVQSFGLGQTLKVFQTSALREVSKKVLVYRNTAWHWQRLMGFHPTPSSYTAENTKSLAYGQWVLSLWKQRSHNLRRMATRWMANRIQYYRSTVQHWQLVMGSKPVRTLAVSGNRETQFQQWRQEARRIMEQASHPPYMSQFICIHGGEGSWTANTGNGYYGGLQMDLSFQSTYGGYLLRTKGTADHWTPLEQIWVAARAARSGRGFYPWPNTARACGLI